MNTVLAWPVFVGIGGIVLAIAVPKARSFVVAAIVVYFAWSFLAHQKAKAPTDMLPP